MIKKILIANRGEIAVRIIRAAQELGIKTVAVYSKADKNALHARIADEKICIGESPSKKSYLYYQNILGAACASHADSIHPGYGFLAENADFAAACKALDLIFVGPEPESMRLMGDKSSAKKFMQKAGVPVVPGSDGAVKNLKEAGAIADRIGYPIMIKASAGGGGKGMRIVNSEDELESNFRNATQESINAFGSGKMYLEKYIPNARHIEVQIIGDNYGNIVHLFERECSIQRNHQKLLEESPCQILSEKLRNEICQIAVTAAKNAKYHSAGTVEFIFDVDTNKYYFMEMNTRVQVEHPVTEMVTEVDIVKEQLRIASGAKLSFVQEQIHHLGHAIECRINAEDWEHNFRPSPGIIAEFIQPGGPEIRVDSACFAGETIHPYYDSLIAKVISKGKTREEAISRMKRALNEFFISPIHTTIGFHKKILNHPKFKTSEITTQFIRKYLND